MKVKFNLPNNDKRFEFFKELKSYFSQYYSVVDYSDNYRIIVADGVTEVISDPEGGICYLETPRTILLMIEEYNNCVIFEPYSKRASKILNKFLNNF
jgi:hypothetical protein